MINTKDNLPEAEKDSSRGISIVWIIPLIAISVGAWLAFKTISERGPEIQIIFNEAEGLEPGQTRIKYKDVNVGKVSKITLSNDLTQVYVSARLNKSMSGHLNENTRFWIVRPRISSSGISGLSTLISGIHIAMDPGAAAEQSANTFEGLDTSPEIESGAEGRKFTLTADSLGSLDTSSPVYYRKIQVGEVTHYQLTEDGAGVQIGIFINAPYDKLITNNTRFWNASGVNVEIGTEGVSASLESLISLISGGISFETPLNLEPENEQEKKYSFALHANHRAAIEKPFEHKELFVMYFDGSLRGLRKNSPVEFRGINVGKVLDINITLNHETLEVTAPVLVELHPEIIASYAKIDNPGEMIKTWINRGIRAQLSTSNLLTGQLFIDLVFQENAPRVEPQYADTIAIFPTIPAAFDRLSQTALDTLEKLSKVPFVEISEELYSSAKNLNAALEPGNPKGTISNLNKTLRNIQSITNKLNKTVPALSGKIETSIKKLNKTLDGAGELVSNDSQLIYDIHELMRSLSSAARSFESLTNFLERNPSALLYGKSGNK